MYGDTVASRETVVHLPAPITQPHAVIALAVYLLSALKAACCIDDSSLAIRHHNFGFPPLSAEASGISSLSARDRVLSSEEGCSEIIPVSGGVVGVGRTGEAEMDIGWV